MSHFELIDVPIFAEARFDIAFSHVKYLPVNPGTSFADKNAKSYIEMGAPIFATFDAESIKRVFA